MSRRRAPYTECKLYVDGIPTLDVGQFIRTLACSAYLVTHMHRSRTLRHRRYLTCLRWPLDEIPASATIHMLHWYRRGRRG